MVANKWSTTAISLSALLSLVFKRLLPRLPYILLFFLARIDSADEIKVISAQRNDSMQLSTSGVALGWNWDGVANEAKAISVTVANKHY